MVKLIVNAASFEYSSQSDDGGVYQAGNTRGEHKTAHKTDTDHTPVSGEYLRVTSLPHLLRNHSHLQQLRD
jgi:hypothetical protein